MERGIGILGAGRSGLAAARLLSAYGRRGWCMAEEAPSEGQRRELAEAGFPWREGLPAEDPERVVLSPGIPCDHPLVRGFLARGVRVEPECETGVRFLRGKVLAITGSLGKTTMAMLAGELLRAAGQRVTVSGNIGTPVCEIARMEPEADAHVIELSSFQLESARELAPDAAVCLNLVPNHLDRHGSLGVYAAAKARLFRGMAPGAPAFWPEGFPAEVETAARWVAPLRWPRPAWGESVFASGALAENLCRLWPVLGLWRLPDAAREAEVLRGFVPPPHRRQVVVVPGAGRVVDDSKSTCLAATRAALEAEGEGVHLVAGGVGKGEDPESLSEVLARKRASVYLIGRAAEGFAAGWRGAAAHCEVCGTLERALESVWRRRDVSQSLLFSPGCASFDQFTGFAHRGDEFQRLVRKNAARSYDRNRCNAEK